jgi:hypothetical protein
MTVRVRHSLPFPHVAEQAPHAVQLESSQFTGHSIVLQSLDSESGAHCTPPKATFCAMVRVRILVPVPQLSEHVDQPLHSVTAQSIGHECELQAPDSESDGHERPLN